MKLYYVETNGYDMIVADFGDFRRVHIVDETPYCITDELKKIDDFPQNLSGDDYYDKTAEELIGEAEVLYVYKKDTEKKYLSDYPMPSRYDYTELRAAAVRPNATKDDRMMLLKWMWNFSGNRDWNGECYDISDGGEEKRLYPIEEPVLWHEGEPDQWEAFDAEIR